MADLSYSNEAFNVLNLFYQKDYMVYVEGRDDVCFWEMIFNKTSNIKVEIQDVGGCEELIPYIEKIYNGEIEAIVACDMDLKYFDDTKKEHNRIIRTKKYSIENTMINEEVLLNIIKLLGRYSSKEIKKIDVNQWLEDTYEKATPLVKMDIGNYIFSKGIPIVGDNANRFMQSKNSYMLSSEKIQNHIQKIGIKLSEAEKKELSKIIEKSDSNLSSWLRGHFLFSAALRFVCYTLDDDERKISLSKDAFYSNLMQSFEKNFNESNEEYIYYKNKINLIA
ncbi:DUF4435 domain-containing protein [Pectobacterium sp. B2J-2]|uniref:DUF4435 domain-containing protein n=1 Tax=Pectobacterium sp. B2J-2 TaxID=3385372 RepID=UPI0038FCEFF2